MDIKKFTEIAEYESSLTRKFKNMYKNEEGQLKFHYINLTEDKPEIFVVDFKNKVLISKREA
jgi:hypothetical protein